MKKVFTCAINLLIWLLIWLCAALLWRAVSYSYLALSDNGIKQKIEISIIKEKSQSLLE